MSPFPLRGLYFQSKSVMTFILLYQYPDDSDDLQFHMPSLDFFRNVQKLVATKLPTICQTYGWKLSGDVFLNTVSYFLYPLRISTHSLSKPETSVAGCFLFPPSLYLTQLSNPVLLLQIFSGVKMGICHFHICNFIYTYIQVVFLGFLKFPWNSLHAPLHPLAYCPMSADQRTNSTWYPVH